MDGGVLKIVVDDVDAAGPGSGQDEASERVCERRSAWRKDAVHRIEKERRRNKEKITGTNFDRERATIKTALECLNFESDAVVINAVSGVNTRARVPA